MHKKVITLFAIILAFAKGYGQNEVYELPIYYGQFFNDPQINTLGFNNTSDLKLSLAHRRNSNNFGGVNTSLFSGQFKLKSKKDNARHSFGVPGAKPEEMVTKLGEGTAIKIMDSSTICDYRMINYMEEVADRNNIKTQKEILTAGGTDTAGIQRMNPGGAIAGAISIPTRHIHQSIEMADKDDIRGSIDLLTACLLELDKGNWEFY